MIFRDLTHEEYEKLDQIENEKFLPLLWEAIVNIWNDIFLESSLLKGILLALLSYLVTIIAIFLFFFLQYKAKKYINKYPERII